MPGAFGPVGFVGAGVGAEDVAPEDSSVSEPPPASAGGVDEVTDGSTAPDEVMRLK